MTVLIKRYANRKLYNTDTSRYITLKGIAELVEQGEDVRVIDNETGEDISGVTLSQILVDNERRDHAVPRTLLSDLIQKSGDGRVAADVRQDRADCPSLPLAHRTGAEGVQAHGLEQLRADCCAGDSGLRLVAFQHELRGVRVAPANIECDCAEDNNFRTGHLARRS